MVTTGAELDIISGAPAPPPRRPRVLLAGAALAATGASMALLTVVAVYLRLRFLHQEAAATTAPVASAISATVLAPRLCALDTGSGGGCSASASCLRSSSVTVPIVTDCMTPRQAGQRALDGSSTRERLAPQRPQKAASASINPRHDGQLIVARRARQ